MIRTLVALLLAGCAPSGARFEPSGPLELLANIDDDDGDGVRDGLDEVINGPADLEEFAPVTLLIPCSLGEVRWRVEPPEAAEHLHVFEDHRRLKFDEVLRCGEHRLRVEALRTRSGLWDGRARLIVGSTLAALELRVAPVVFPSILAPAQRVYVVELDGVTAQGNEALLARLEATGLPLVRTHGSERWMQDALSAATQRTSSGRSQQVLVEMDRPTDERGLEGFAATQLGPGRGLARVGRSERNTLSYGGNVEVIPAHGGFPQGRLIIGGGADRHMGASTRAWLDAQEVQGPPLEVPTQWLATGHVDELVTFVPSQRPSGWVAAVASPRLAWAVLEAAQRDGRGSARVHTRTGERTVDALLDDPGLRAFNLAASRQLDALRTALAQSVPRDDIVELPQLFDAPDGGLAQALHPSVVNVVSVGPWVLALSPDVDGGVLEPVVREVFAREGLDVQFIDASGAYHRFGGGLHCAVELERQPQALRRPPARP